MNNDLPLSWKFEEVVTINCEFSLFGLMGFRVAIICMLIALIWVRRDLMNLCLDPTSDYLIMLESG